MSDNVQFEGEDLTFEGQVITFQSETEPQSQEQEDPRFIAWATSTELGKNRYRRLRLLGHF